MIFRRSTKTSRVLSSGFWTSSSTRATPKTQRTFLSTTDKIFSFTTRDTGTRRQNGSTDPSIRSSHTSSNTQRTMRTSKSENMQENNRFGMWRRFPPRGTSQTWVQSKEDRLLRPGQPQTFHQRGWHCKLAHKRRSSRPLRVLSLPDGNQLP